MVTAGDLLLLLPPSSITVSCDKGLILKFLSVSFVTLLLVPSPSMIITGTSVLSKRATLPLLTDGD
jgi:hypothetical protein